jgi:glucokinase
MYIGIDLGGTNIAAGLVDDDGVVLLKDSVETKATRPASDIIKDMAELVNKIIDESEFSRSNIKAVGIGIPGVADEASGEVIYCVNLNWEKVPLKKPLEELLKLPVIIGNDATVAGVAEYGAGKMKGCKNGVFLTLGTGVGGGMIIDGKAYGGSHGVGSEIGHMVVGDNFYDCNCGRNGCLETFASATALIKYAQKELDLGRKSNLEEHSGRLNAKLIFDGAKSGDELSVETVDRLVHYLSIGISNLINILDPDCFVIGGGVSKAGDFLINKVRKEIEGMKSFASIESGRIEIATLENDAGIIGAAMLGKFNCNQ